MKDKTFDLTAWADPKGTILLGKDPFIKMFLFFWILYLIFGQPSTGRDLFAAGAASRPRYRSVKGGFLGKPAVRKVSRSGELSLPRPKQHFVYRHR